MANQQLVNYIKDSLVQGRTKDQIRQSLVSTGWQNDDIDEVMGSLILNSDADILPKSISPQNKDARPVQMRYVGFWTRFIAAAIDGLIVGAMTKVLFIFLNALNLSFLNPISFLIGWAYFIFMTYEYQATLGKQIFGIRVISDDETNRDLNLGQVILRETIGKIVSSMIILIGYIMAGFTERKQALHDKIAKTLVIYSK